MEGDYTQLPWDYSQFAAEGAGPRAAHRDGTIDLEFHMMPDEGTAFNRWMVNGKEFPHTNPIRSSAARPTGLRCTMATKMAIQSTCTVTCSRS